MRAAGFWNAPKWAEITKEVVAGSHQLVSRHRWTRAALLSATLAWLTLSAGLRCLIQIVLTAFFNKANTAISFLLNTKCFVILDIQTTTGFHAYQVPVLLINSSSRYIYAKHPRLFSSSTVRLNFATVKIVVFMWMHLSLEAWHGEFWGWGWDRVTTLREHGEEVIWGRPHLQRLSPTPILYSPWFAAHHFRATKVILTDLERPKCSLVWGAWALPSYPQSCCFVTLPQPTSTQKSMTESPENHHLTHGDMLFGKWEARNFPVENGRQRGSLACRTVTRTLPVWETGPEFRETTSFHGQLHQF